MKTFFLPIALAAMVSAAVANTAPTVVIQSAAMRPGTTLMDVVYRVNDPDDTTVKTRALAFVDGVRSFSNVLRPVTFVEGTAAKLGDAIPANVDHTLTWDVAADWNIDLGQIQVEVLAMDGRGLLPFDWFSIPAAGANPAVSISRNTPTEQQKLDALFWLYASGDPGLVLNQGVVSTTSQSGVFSGLKLAAGAATRSYSAPFLFKQMNLAIAEPLEAEIATAARAGQASGWLASNRPYDGLSTVVNWGADNWDAGLSNIPDGMSGVIAISAGNAYYLALNNRGKVFAWGYQGGPVNQLPGSLNGVIAIAAGNEYALALKNDGIVVGWGNNNNGQITIPSDLSNVTAIAAGNNHSLALKSDGTVVGWGNNNNGQITIPLGLSNVTAIAAGNGFSLALKGDGTVVKWGNPGGAVPTGLAGVQAIASHAIANHSLALKTDGTVVGWGQNYNGQITIPSGLGGVVAIAAGASHSMALKGDGTVVCWGNNANNMATPPSGLGGVTSISGGQNHSLALKAKAP